MVLGRTNLSRLTEAPIPKFCIAFADTRLERCLHAGAGTVMLMNSLMFLSVLFLFGGLALLPGCHNSVRFKTSMLGRLIPRLMLLSL